MGEIKPANAAALFDNGYEEGNLASYTGSSGTPTVEITHAHSGTYGCKINASEYAYYNTTNTGVIAVRTYIYIVTHATGFNKFLGICLNTALGYPIAAEISVSGSNYNWSIYDGYWTASHTDSGITLSTGIWYEVELDVNKTTPYTARLYVNDVIVATRTLSGALSWNTGKFGGEATGCEYWLDDNVIDTQLIESIGVDTTKPVYSNLQVSNSYAGNSTVFSLKCDDNLALSPKGQYQFGTNTTGTFTWDSLINFTGTPQWANVTKTLSVIGGAYITYAWNFTDNSGNFNCTGLFTLVTIIGVSKDTSAMLVSEDWEAGQGSWTTTPYDAGYCVITTNQAFNGTHSLWLNQSQWMRAFTNTNPTATVYQWAWVKNTNLSAVTNVGGAGLFEIRNDTAGANIMGFPQMYSIDSGVTWRWRLACFNMTPPHNGFASSTINNWTTVSANTWYKVVMSYQHIATRYWLNLWINDIFIASAEQDSNFNFVAGNIYAGNPKALYNSQANWTYIDCEGIDFDYPYGNPYSVGEEPSGNPQIMINSPQNTIYDDATAIPLNVSIINADSIWYNVFNSSSNSWVYPINQTYTEPITLANIANGTGYVIYVTANNTAGVNVTGMVQFSAGNFVYAATGSADDIQAAVDIAHAYPYGGTVYVPVGNFTFNINYTKEGGNNRYCGVRLYPGVNLIGAGENTTILYTPLTGWHNWYENPNGVSMFTCVSTSSYAGVRISGILFQGSVNMSAGMSDVWGLSGLLLYGLFNYRVDHCTFIDFQSTALGVSGNYAQDLNSSRNCGVIDHCIFDNPYKDVFYTNTGVYPLWAYGIVASGNYPQTNWYDPDVPDMLGSNQWRGNIAYIEDCSFARCRHAIAGGSQSGGFYVARFCNFTDNILNYYGSMQDVHGGARGAILYNCTFTNVPTDYRSLSSGYWGLYLGIGLYSRGGCALYYHNTFVNWPQSGSDSATAIVLTNDQSNSLYRTTGVYIWSNTYVNSATTVKVVPNTFAITLNVDYFLRQPNNIDDGFHYAEYAYPFPFVGASQVVGYSESISVTIISPTNITYDDSAVALHISVYVTDGTVDTIWWNCKNGTAWIYASNQTYTFPTIIYGLSNGTSYRLYVLANATGGSEDVATVIFTVSIPSYQSPLEVSLNTPANLATSASFTVSFVYTPTVRDDIFYHSELWLNLSGIYQIAAYNSSIIANYTTNTITYVFSVNNTYIWNIKIWNSTTGVFASSNRILTISVSGVDWYQITVNCISLDSANVNAYLTKQFLNGSTILSYTEGQASLLAGTITVRASYLDMLVNETSFVMATYGNSTVSLTVNMKALSMGGFLAVNKSAAITFKNQTGTLINATITAAGSFQVACLVPANASLVQLDGVNVTDWLFNATNLSIRANLTSGDFSMSFAETLGEPWFGVSVVLVSLGSLGSAIWYYRRSTKKKSKVVPAG